MLKFITLPRACQMYIPLRHTEFSLSTKNCHKTVYTVTMIYSMGSLHPIKMCTLARKWCLQNNPHTLRIRLSIDVVFYIFKISHGHAVFGFRLSARAGASCWALSWKEWREMITHIRVMGGPSITVLSRPRISQEVFAFSGLGSWLIYLFSKYQFELWYVKSLFLMLWIPGWK